MPITTSLNIGYPIPGATTDDLRLADVVAIRDALIAIDAKLQEDFMYLNDVHQRISNEVLTLNQRISGVEDTLNQRVTTAETTLNSRISNVESTLHGRVDGVLGTLTLLQTLNPALFIDTRPTVVVTTTATNVDEGQSVEFTVTTTNVPDGTVLDWEIAGGKPAVGDYESPTGIVTITNGTGTLYVRPMADNLTEGPVTFNVMVSNTTLGIQATSVSDTGINDTSTTPAFVFQPGYPQVTAVTLNASYPDGTVGFDVSFVVDSVNPYPNMGVTFGTSEGIYTQGDGGHTMPEDGIYLPNTVYSVSNIWASSASVGGFYIECIAPDGSSSVASAVFN